MFRHVYKMRGMRSSLQGNFKRHMSSTPEAIRANQVMFFASEVSGLTGHNPYVRYHDAFDKVFMRNFPVKYQDLRMSVKKETGIEVLSKDEKVQAELKRTGTAKLIHDVVKDQVPAEMNVADIKAVEKETLRKLDEKLVDEPETVKEQIRDHYTGQIRTSYGTRAEELAVSDYEEQRAVEVETVANVFYKAQIGETQVEHYPVLIGGRVDGFADGKLIEIKNRVRQFFNPIPVYDLVQFQCYLKILDLTEGEFVQRLKHSLDPALSSEIIARDDVFFDNEILPALMRTATMIEIASTNDDVLSEYLILKRPKDKENFLQSQLAEIKRSSKL